MRTGYRILFSMLFLLFCASVGLSASAADGWQAFWAGRHEEAHAAFAQVSAANPQEAEALWGKAVLLTLEDRPQAALQTFRECYAVDTASWRASAYWPWAVQFAYETGGWNSLDTIAGYILADPAAHPSLRSSARVVLARALDRAGKKEEADREYARSGYVRQWRVIGPFDNISLSGFAKVFPPEQEIDFSKSYPGQDDMTLRWYDLAAVSRDGTCEVSTSLGNAEATVFYAATAVYVEQACPVVMCYKPSGASHLYLNGQPVFYDEVYRSYLQYVEDPFRIPVQLQPGWNTLLVKLADDEEIGASFALRMTTPDGRDLADVPVDPARATMPVAQPGAVPAATHPETEVVAVLRQVEPSLERAALLGNHLREGGDYETAIAELRGALANAPHAGWLHWILCRALEADGHINEARAERDLARNANPWIAQAELDYLNECEDTLSASEQLAKAKALVERFPESAEAQWALCYAYECAEMETEMMNAARAARRAAPGESNTDRLVSWLQDQSLDEEAEQVLQEAIQADPTAIELLATRATQLISRGDKPAGQRVLERLVELDPTSFRWRWQLAELALTMNDIPMAIRHWEALTQLCPQHAMYYEKLADAKRNLEQIPEALALYKQAIVLDPSKVALREKVKILSGEKPILALAPAIPTETILESAKQVTVQHGESAVVLLDESRTLIYPDYASESRIHQIIKIFDDAGVERFSSIYPDEPTSTAEATVELARVIKPDGTIHDVTDESYYSIDFPSLAPGDIIDYVYRVEDFKRGALSRHFWGLWSFNVIGIPVKESRLAMITPAAMVMTMRPQDRVPQVQHREVDGWRVSEWRAKDLPPIPLEKGSPPPRDCGIWIDFSTVSSWADIVQWYRDLSGPYCTADAVVRQKAQELTQGLTSDEDKIAAILNYVSGEIRYQTTPFRMSAFRPTPGKQVIHDRYGDCKDKAVLVAALLDAVGIKADVALLSGRSEGLTPLLPSPRFSHAVSVIYTKEGPVWADATAESMPFGQLPMEDQGVPALIINEATTDLVVTPISVIDRNVGSAAYRCALDAKGNLSGTVTMQYTDSMGAMIRSALARVPKSQHEQVLQYLLGTVLQNARYESGSFEGLEDATAPLGIILQFTMPQFAGVAGNFIMCKLPWSFSDASTDAMIRNPQRMLDLEIASSAGWQRHTVELTFPKGYAPKDLQPTVAAESPWGSFTCTYEMKGNTLYAACDYRISALRIPAEDLPEFRTYWEQLSVESGRQLIFSK
jgi:tetratricopeptide (TPR) repeat protein